MCLMLARQKLVRQVWEAMEVMGSPRPLSSGMFLKMLSMRPPRLISTLGGNVRGALLEGARPAQVRVAVKVDRGHPSLAPVLVVVGKRFRMMWGLPTGVQACWAPAGRGAHNPLGGAPERLLAPYFNAASLSFLSFSESEMTLNTCESCSAGPTFCSPSRG